jgi:hypothetical protein
MICQASPRTVVLTSVAEEVVKKVVVLVFKNIRSGAKAQTYCRRLPARLKRLRKKSEKPIARG